MKNFKFLFIFLFAPLIKIINCQNCLNGGFLWSNKTGCNCPSYWEPPYCANTSCTNSGRLDSSKKFCTCPPGYQGVHCEAVLEFDTPANTFALPDRSFNVFINLYVASNYYTGNTFQLFVNSIVTYINTLYPLNGIYRLYSTNSPLPIVNTTSKSGFTSAVNGTLAQFQDPDLYSCANYASNVNLYENLFNMIETNQLQRTSINVYTQFPATSNGDSKYDPADQSYASLEERAVAYGVAINFYFGDEPYLIGCTFKELEINRMRYLSFVTGGLFIVYKSGSSGQVLPALLPIQANPQLLYFDSHTTCPPTVNIDIPIDNSFQDLDDNTFRIIAKTQNPTTATLTAICSSLNPTNSAVLLANSSEVGVKVYGFTTFFVGSSDRTCKISWTPLTGGGSCSIQIYANGIGLNNNLGGVQVYTTYTDRTEVDSAYINMTSGAFLYSRFRIQPDLSTLYTNININTAIFHGSDGSNVSYAVIQRTDPPSTFNFITVNQSVCKLTDVKSNNPNYWLEIKFNMSDSQNYEYTRAIPVKCFAKEPTTVNLTNSLTGSATVLAANASTLVADEQDKINTETAASKQKNEAAEIAGEIAEINEVAEIIPDETIESTPFTSDCASQVNSTKPSLIVGWSGGVSQNFATGFVEGFNDLYNNGILENFYNNFGTLPLDVPSSGVFPCVDTVNFTPDPYTFVKYYLIPYYNTLYINGTCGVIPDSSNLVNQLYTTLTTNEAIIKQSSILFFLVDGKAITDFSLALNLTRHAMANRYYINFIMDISDYNFNFNSTSSKTIQFYQSLSSLTDGHFIVLDTISRLRTVTTDIFSQYFNQRLVLSYEAYDMPGATVLGTVDMTEVQGNRMLYLTVSDLNTRAVFDPIKLLFVTVRNSLNNTVNPSFDRNINSSFVYLPLYNATGNDTYTITITYILPSPMEVHGIYPYQAVFRVWQEIQLGDQDALGFNVQYLDSNKTDIQLSNGPDTKVGATLKTTLSANSLISKSATAYIEYFDCNNNNVESQVLDQWNWGWSVTTSDTDCGNNFVFDPYFCTQLGDGLQCPIPVVNSTGDTYYENYYHVKYTIKGSNGRAYQLQSKFLCPYNQIAKGECNGGGDPNGNTCECGLLDQTYYRGPICQVFDCSGNGHLRFNDTKKGFNCECDNNNVNGSNCQTGSCDSTTINVQPGANDLAFRTLTVGLVYSSNDEFARVYSFTNNTISKANLNVTNIWQFHLFVGCDSYAQSIYIGPSFSSFKNALNGLTNSSIPVSTCFGSLDTDLTNLIKFGLLSIGIEIKGLFWIASANSTSIFVDDSESYNQTEFFNTMHGYKQEVMGGNAKRVLYILYSTAVKLYITSFFNDTTDNDYSLTTAPAYTNTLIATRATGGQRFDLSVSNATDSTYCFLNWLVYLLSAPVSINEYLFLNKTTSSGIDVYLENSGLIMYSGLQPLGLTPPDPSACADKYGGFKAVGAGLLTLGITYTPSNLNEPLDYVVSARVINTQYPLPYIFIDEISSDQAQALPITNTKITMALGINGSVNLYDADNSHRLSFRQGGCTFPVTSTIENPSIDPTYSEFKFNLTADNKSFTKIIPYIVNDKINCKNGNIQFPGRPYCQCANSDANFSGADCSRANCGSNGVLNTMRTACNCNTGYYGPTCNTNNLTSFYSSYSMNYVIDNERKHQFNRYYEF